MLYALDQELHVLPALDGLGDPVVVRRVHHHVYEGTQESHKLAAQKRKGFHGFQEEDRGRGEFARDYGFGDTVEQGLLLRQGL